jgi:hypothetical protein
MSIGNLKTEGNHIYHGPAVYTNYYNGIHFAKSLGYKNAICFNFDMVIKDTTIIPKLIIDLVSNKAVYNLTRALEGNALRTVFFATNIDFFINNFNFISNDVEYNDWKTNVGSESNGLENMFYHTLKGNLTDIKTLSDDEFYGMLSGCDIDLCSRVEYFNVLPIKDSPDQFAVWFSTNNLVDDRKFRISIEHNNKFDNIDLQFKTNQNYYKIIDFVDGEYNITLYENNNPSKKITVDKNYMYNKIKNNGELIIK